MRIEKGYRITHEAKDNTEEMNLCLEELELMCWDIFDMLKLGDDQMFNYFGSEYTVNISKSNNKKESK